MDTESFPVYNNNTHPGKIFSGEKYEKTILAVRRKRLYKNRSD